MSPTPGAAVQQLERQVRVFACPACAHGGGAKCQCDDGTVPTPVPLGFAPREHDDRRLWEPSASPEGR